MYCKHCGTEIDSDSTYCSNCGKPVLYNSLPKKEYSVDNSHVSTDEIVRVQIIKENKDSDEN